MTLRQWVWLWIWLLLFFIAFCVWNKLQERVERDEVLKLSKVKETIPPKITKDINIKITKDRDNIKVSGVFNSKDDLDRVKLLYKGSFTSVDTGMIIVDKSAKNSEITELIESLSDDFSKFKEGSLSYSRKTISIDGVVDDRSIKDRVSKYLSKFDKNITIIDNLTVDSLPVEPKKVLTKEVNASKDRVIDIKEIQQKIDRVLKTYRVGFIYAKDRLTPDGRVGLDKIYNILNRYRDIEVEIGGHTDSDGTRVNNLKLSQKRAEIVKNYLLSKGIASDRLRAVGYGEDRPLVKNNSAKNREINRRVEVKIIAQKGER